MKKSIRFTSFVFIFLLFSSYSLFSQDTVETIVRESAVQSETAILNIRTNISGVEIYINGLYKGISPLIIEDMTPATYTIQLKKDGWERKSVFVQLKAQTETNLYFELIPITGFLRVKSNIRDANIYLDGTLIDIGNSTDTGLIEVQEGLHTVEIKKFGYVTQSETVNVYERFLSDVVFEVEKSLFSVSSFSANPSRFNPNAPGGFAFSQFSFTVTAPGSVTFSVFDKNNVLIYSEDFLNVTSAHHSAKWNGKNMLGIVLPEGSYRTTLEGKPSEGWQIFSFALTDGSETGTVTSELYSIIDYSIFYPIIQAGASGSSVGVTNARLMPSGTSLVSLSGSTDFSLEEGFSAFPFSVQTVFTPLSILEFSLRLGAEAESSVGDNFPMFFGGSVKIASKYQNAYFGGVLRYTYATEKTYSSIFSEPGLGFGFITGIEVGPVLFSLSEEVVFGSETGNVGAFDGHVKSAIGMQFQKGSFSSSLWTSLYSPFTLNGMSLFEKFEVGVDASFLLPNTIFAPTLGCSYRYSELYKGDISLRFGLQFFVL